MVRRVCVALILSVSMMNFVLAQEKTEPRYTPRKYEHQGRENVAVVVGASGCGWSKWPQYMAVVDPMLRKLKEQAEDRGLLFTAIGIAVEDVEPGLAYLQQLAAFDEVLVGGTWLNTGVVHYLWGKARVEPGTPTLVLLERRFSAGVKEPRKQTTRVLKTITGAENIIAFANAGASLPR